MALQTKICSRIFLSRHLKAGSLLFFMIIIVFSGIAQEKRGDNFVKELAFIKAIDAYTKAIDKSGPTDQLYFKVAETYRRIKDYQSAALYFRKIENIDTLPSKVHLYYGQILMTVKDMRGAKEQFQLFSEKNPNSLIGQLALQSVDKISSWRMVNRPFRVDTISGINTKFSEFSPVKFKDALLFTSDRNVDYQNDRKFGWNNQPYLSIYQAKNKPQSNQEFEEVALFSNRLTTPYHDGPITFDSSYTQAFFTRVNKQNKLKDFTNRMKIYSVEWDGKRWRKEQLLGFNSDQYSCGQPYFNSDRNRLYFSSDMPGGFGGMDLYYVVKAENGWSKPINLGRFINTTGDEVFPTGSGDKLYFSSNGLSGYGGLDMFESQITSTDHTQPINLKTPINTSADDFGLYFFDNQNGYFSSNRPGGMGSDDIYLFHKLDSAHIDTAQISGVFEFNGLPVEGVKLNLTDEDGNTVEVVYTDEKGRFVFSSLPSDQNYIVTIDEEDNASYSNANIFITNQNGEKVILTDRLADGSFAFKSLPLDLINQLELLDEEDETLNSFVVTAQVYEKLPGDITIPKKLYLYDDSGQLIDSVFTDKKGRAIFRQLGFENNYLIALAEEEPSTSFALINGKNRIVSLPLKNDENKVSIDNSAFVNLNFLTNRKSEKTIFIGQVEDRNGVIENLKLTLLNLYGDTLASTFTNDIGTFEFANLTTNENYLIRVNDYASISSNNVSVYALNANGNKIARVDRLMKGDFTFNALPFDKVNAKEFPNFQDNLIRINGQIFKQLPGDFSDSIEVLLLDEEGFVIGKTFTDANGRFQFNRLNPDGNYSFIVNEQEGGDLSLILEDEEYNMLANTIRTGKGKFEYTKLTAEIGVLEQLDEKDDEPLVFAKGDNALFGQLYKKLPNDYTSQVMIYLLDEEGNIIDAVLTDKNGRFKFESLVADEIYSFKVGDQAEDLNIVIYDQEDNIVASAARLGRGNFKFSKLDIEKASIPLEEITDTPIYYAFSKPTDSLRYMPLDTAYQDFLNQYVIYYNFDSDVIDSTEMLKLNNLIEKLIRQPNIDLEVISYADPMGPERYNEKLSKRRTKSVIDYFQQKGVKRSRLKGFGKGEINLLLIQDIINVPLTKEQNRINRRTEFKIYMK